MGILVLVLLALVLLALVGPVIGFTINLLIAMFLWMLAGMFARRILRGRGYGPLGDVLLGLIGGFVGSWVLGLIGISLGGGIIGNLIVGTLGAVIIVYIGHLLNGGSRRAA